MPDETHKRAFETIDAWVGQPNGGLPEEFFLFLSRYTPLVNVDLLIQDARRGTLLTWRQDDIYGAGWHVPGGIIRYKETAEARIHATALAELGTPVEFDPEPLSIHQSIDSSRRERGHFISLLYICRLAGPLDESRAFTRGEPQREQWAWHRDCPPNLIAAQQHYRTLISGIVLDPAPGRT